MELQASRFLSWSLRSLNPFGALVVGDDAQSIVGAQSLLLLWSQEILIVTNFSPGEKLWSSRASCFLSWSFGSLNPFGAVTVEDDAGWTCCDETQTSQDKLYFGIHTGHHRRNVVPCLFLNLMQITLFPEELTNAIVAKSRTEFLFFQ